MHARSQLCWAKDRVQRSKKVLLPSTDNLSLMSIRRRAWTLAGVGGVAVGLTLLSASPAAAPVRFVDVTGSAGITFRHQNAASPEKHLIETMGSGCAWIDYDRDGLLDLYLVNSAGRSVLYRNKGDGSFADVTSKAGVGADGLFGMGVAVGDYDNDGYPDLMVLGYDRSILYHNNRNGTFSDVTERAGV